jgi:DNA-binding NarL/FixJ family response regulator
MPSQPLRIGIVEDHPLFMDLVAHGLGAIEGLVIFATAGTLSEARKWFRPEEFDILILDIELPDGNGFGLGVELRRQNPALGIVLLSGRDALELLEGLPADERRGWSYLTKESTKSIDYLAAVIRATSRGEVLIDRALTDRSRAKSGTSVSFLSARQFEILRAVARGDSNQSIGQQIGIAANSVGNHLIAIYDALGLPEGKNSRVAAVLEFLRSTSRDDSNRLEFHG